MKKFLEDFTLIDFWGIMIPGGIFCFLMSSVYSLGQLYTEYVGVYVKETSEIGLAAFWVLISYLLGSIIHEGADWIERLFSAASSIFVKTSNKWLCFYMPKRAFLWLDSDSTAYITDQFSLHKKDKGIDSARHYRKAVNHIAAELFMTSAPGKTKMFESFRIMARNSAVAVSFWMVVSIWHHIDVVPGQSALAASHRLIGVIVILIFLIRAMHYTYLKYKYYYESYYQLHNVKQAPDTKQAPAAESQETVK